MKISQMQNITLTLDNRLAAWGRIHSAQNGRSLSALVEELLRERMRQVLCYEEAMQQFLARKPFDFEWDGRHRLIRSGHE